MNAHRRQMAISQACCEALERRMLLSLSPAGAEFRVNSFTTNAQQAPAVASDADGDLVVVWEGNGSDDVGGVFARRHNALGQPQGGDFRVNATIDGFQGQPAVAMDADGDFVVVWAGSAFGDNAGVFAQRYNAAGIAKGNEFRVNTFTTGGQALSTVAMDAGGNFVVAWASIGQDGSGQGIYAQRYNAAGIAQGNEFRVNTRTTSDQTFPAVAMAPDGRFAIAWTDNYPTPEPGGSGQEVYCKRYSASGVAMDNEFHVNTFTTGTQGAPAIAVDAAFNFVVTWHSDQQDGPGNFGIYGQRYNSSGAPQGNEFRVNSTTATQQLGPSVAMDADGDFFVTWHSYGQDGSDAGVYGRDFNAAGVPQADEFRVNTFTTNNQKNSAVTMDANGDAVVVWQSNLQDGSGEGVYAQRYDESRPDTAPPIVSDMLLPDVAIAPGEFLHGVGSLTLSFSEEMSVVGGTGGASSATNPANYRLLRNGLDVSSQIASAAFAFNTTSRKFEAILSFSSLLAPGDYSLSARDVLLDVAGNALDGDLDGIAGSDFTRAFVVVSREFRVNSTTETNQRSPAIASDADGNFVVVWEGSDGNGYGIYAQRYNRAAIPQGHEFRVNTTTLMQQFQPSVAMDPDGDFVVVWSGNVPLDSQGIAMQRFNALGVPQGGEIRVNTFTTNVQEQPKVAMDADGNFVVVWAGASAGTQIFAQRFNAAGVQQGSEFLVNTTIQGRQPDVAMDADGDFVVVFTADYLPGGKVHYRRFNASGIPQGPGIFVNTEPVAEEVPAVAMGADGDFVVAWTRVTNFDERDILVRRFDAAGVPQANAFLINTFTAGRQEDPEIGMDASGGFVVSWSSGNQDGSGFGVFARRYNAAGTAFTPEFRVNTFTTGGQDASAVGMLSNEEFVITWTSHGQISNSLDVYGQLFPSPQASDSEFIFDTAPHRVRFRFSEDVSASLGSDDLILENLTTMQTIPADQLLLTYDTTTNTATFRFAGLVSSILPDGNYRATLLAAGISSAAGVPMQANHVFNFFFLNGDANRDGRVNLADFNILAANFGQSPRTFSQGDFNYDETVNLQDFNILAARFGSSVAPHERAGVFATAERDRDRETLEELR